MPNKNYQKGRRKEYKICKEFRENGWTMVQRSAGSHSPIDIFAINKETKRIKFIQAKPNNFSKKAGERIKEELNYLNDEYLVDFELI